MNLHNMSSLNKLNLKIFLNSPEDEKGLQSARQKTPSMKNNFSFFLNRKDRKDKRNIRNSDLSENSSCISGDIIYEKDNPKTSRVSGNKVSPVEIKHFFQGHRNTTLIKDVKPFFALFEGNVKDNYLNSHRLSLNKIVLYNKLKDKSLVNYFSIENNIKIEDECSLLPSLVQEDIKIQIEVNLKNKNDILNDISLLTTQLKENHEKINKLKTNDKVMINELKEIKNARNKLISERVILINEIDYLKSVPSQNNMKFSTDRSAYQITHTIDKGSIFCTTTSQTKNQNDTIILDDHDYTIDQLENKLSSLKLENRKFYENIDILDEEYAVNEDKNKEFKSYLKQLDKMIENVVKERNSLKNVYVKLFP